MNLPADVQRVVHDESKLIHKVFIPEVINNQENRQHPAPPLFDQLGDDDDIKSVDFELPKMLIQNVHTEDTEENPSSNDYRRNFIKKMALFGWQNYEKYAWGENELRPLSRTGHSAGIFGSSTKLGATIVDGLDTMYLMGFMDEVARGREWIAKNFNLKVNSDVSVFEISIRFIGGFLSMYTLTKDKVR